MAKFFVGLIFVGLIFCWFKFAILCQNLAERVHKRGRQGAPTGQKVVSVCRLTLEEASL